MVSINESYAFRCGHEIVGRWDTKQTLLRKCGNPSKTSYEVETINGVKKYVEKWYYNCGELDFIYALWIDQDGVVFKDDPVQRGIGPSQCRQPK